MATAAPRLVTPSPAEHHWRAAADAAAVDDATWLLLSPRPPGTTYPVTDGRELTLTVGLATGLRLVSGPTRPAVQPTPLPPLGHHEQRPPHSQLPFQVGVSLADASGVLAQRLAASASRGPGSRW